MCAEKLGVLAICSELTIVCDMEKSGSQNAVEVGLGSIDHSVNASAGSGVSRKPKILKKNRGDSDFGKKWNLRDKDESDDESSESEVGNAEDAEDIPDEEDNAIHALDNVGEPEFRAEIMPSVIDQKSLMGLVKAYCIHHTIKVRVPLPFERACWPSNDEVAFYSNVFRRGVRLPMHKFFKDVAANYGISPAQITPNGYSHMMGMLLIWHDLKFGVPSMLEWNSIYQIAKAPGGPGYYYFTRWPGGDFGMLILKGSSASGNWKRDWFWVTSGEASEESPPRAFNKARYLGSRHEAKGILLKRIENAFSILEEDRCFEVLRAGRTVSAIKISRRNPPRPLRRTDIKPKAKADSIKEKNTEPLGNSEDVPLKKKAKVTNPALTPSLDSAIEMYRRPDSVIVNMTLNPTTKESVPETPVVDENGNEAVPQNSLSCDPSSINWSKMQTEMISIDVGNLEAAELVAHALNLFAQASRVLSSAQAKLEESSKLKAEVATLWAENEKACKEKQEAEEKLKAAEEEHKSLMRERVSKMEDSYAVLKKESTDTIACLKSEVENHAKTITGLQNELDAARRGEGLDFKKIVDSEAFKPFRATMEMEIGEGLIGMIEERDPNFDSSFLRHEPGASD